ncbi:DUF2487 family protein [Paenibacillus montanisoli]|uniref:DUF2487 domain-containing protein n=1 Tax=Paenibacillus montanisoli TaxID=2081970 RepID=A0A328U0Q3_9BACL|nr:DUF2487 family protein [Paenibacillus montanisoli]RAP76368.1 DUF2487 domain-containing protein [Paenibacillus montanisoli]
MKFSELSAEGWAELQPYLDTAVLPVTGLTGEEMPYEATAKLERLRDVLDLIEIPFKGRIVTYPACQYGEWTPAFREQLDRICGNFRQAGFKHVVVVTAVHIPDAAMAEESGADLIISPGENGQLPAASSVSESVRKLWLGRA